MKNFLAFAALVFVGIAAQGQKDTRKTFDASEIERIVLSGDQIFRITASTSPEKTIEVRTHSEGEYFNDISFDSRIADGTLFLDSRFREILESGYDKLSAHKVFSMEVEMMVPEGIELVVNSNLASVFLSGAFAEVLVQLSSGSCYLSAFSGDATVNTFGGNIEIGTDLTKASITADSRHGTVEVPSATEGKNKIVLTSIHGNIKVHKTK